MPVADNFLQKQHKQRERRLAKGRFSDPAGPAVRNRSPRVGGRVCTYITDLCDDIKYEFDISYQIHKKEAGC
jgi:hypothetical protein